jgi:hypothetical protein
MQGWDDITLVRASQALGCAMYEAVNPSIYTQSAEDGICTSFEKENRTRQLAFDGAVRDFLMWGGGSARNFEVF